MGSVRTECRVSRTECRDLSTALRFGRDDVLEEMGVVGCWRAGLTHPR
jgi:hypothetical protein